MLKLFLNLGMLAHGIGCNTILKGNMMMEDKEIIAAQGERIAILEREIHSIYDELASIRNVTGGIIKATGMLSAVRNDQNN